MEYGQWLFNELRDVVKAKPENFFMNTHQYRNCNIVMFDYSLTIPNDFGYGQALEARGSCFRVDDKGEYVSIVALPFEKFFNLHEYDYEGNHDLKESFTNRYGVECDSSTVGLLADDPDTIIMDKRDGSIITFFELGGKLDCKSNSSLTSDYKEEALTLLETRYPELYALIEKVCSAGYSVSTEYTSNNPYRQIVIPYDKDEIIVTGVRSHKDGTYVPYDKMVSIFGKQYVVEQINKPIDVHAKDETDIEGYVIWHQPSGLHFKVKTEWYLERHRIKAEILTPSNVWELYINGNIDDVGLSVPESNKPIFEYFMNECETLYTDIVSLGKNLYEENKHLDRKDFFSTAIIKDPKYVIAGSLARHLYLGTSMHDALELIKRDLLIKRNISRMGIPLWRYDGFDYAYN